ncbi:MAG TPA: pilus assembly protein PilP [Methylophilaceae bacterium]|nr:pilus assembly protein PilP [Methylophilaceae bacterium]
MALCTLLAGCSSKGDDLDKFMSEAGKGMRARIPPLPEVKPYVPFEYNADNSLNDPFRPRKAQSNDNTGKQPDMNRPKQPLEAFPLESLKFVGSISRNNLKYALIKTPDNSIHQVQIGNYVGQNFGIVTDITESGVMLKEIVQDDVSGDWIERPASINLQE